MNVEKLRELQKFIQIEPRRFTMKEGLQNFDKNWYTSKALFLSRTGLLEMPPCETAGCLAGEAVMMEHPEVTCRLWGSVYDEAKTILGLKTSQAERLFYFNDRIYGVHIDRDFARRYEKAETPQERVQVAVDFIDHFIKTEQGSEENVTRI